MLVIDEAQRVPNIGLTLKRLVDANERLAKPTKIYVTGSSSLDLAKGVKESAVGRLVMREMWPLSISEIAAFRSWGEVRQNIDLWYVPKCFYRFRKCAPHSERLL